MAPVDRGGPPGYPRGAGSLSTARKVRTMASHADSLSPDEIEQRQSATPDDDGDDLDHVQEPLTPDEIEQRMTVGWDDEDQPLEDDDDQ